MEFLIGISYVVYVYLIGTWVLWGPQVPHLWLLDGVFKCLVLLLSFWGWVPEVLGTYQFVLEAVVNVLEMAATCEVEYFSVWFSSLNCYSFWGWGWVPRVLGYLSIPKERIILLSKLWRYWSVWKEKVCFSWVKYGLLAVLCSNLKLTFPAHDFESWLHQDVLLPTQRGVTRKLKKN